MGIAASALMIFAATVADAPPRFVPRPVFAPRPAFPARETSGASSATASAAAAIPKWGAAVGHSAAAPSPALPVASPRVILWGAPWCAPCRALKPHIERLRQQGWPIEDHDADAEQATFAGWGLRAVPAVQVIAPDGREIGRLTPQSAEDITGLLGRLGIQPRRAGQ